MDYYLSLKASKQLKDWGCYLEAKKKHITYDNPATKREEYQTYHILEDVCVRYAKEFFGTRKIQDSFDDWNHTYTAAYIYETRFLLELLQQNKKQEAEQYILDNCLFNPKNKVF